MDIAGLERLSVTMLELIGARNKRLLEALDERDRLQHEISVKKEIIVPVISLVQMGEVATPSKAPDSAYGTPMSSKRTPKNRLLTRTQSLTPDSSTASPNSARRIMTKLRFWESADKKEQPPSSPSPEVKV